MKVLRSYPVAPFDLIALFSLTETAMTFAAPKVMGPGLKELKITLDSGVPIGYGPITEGEEQAALTPRGPR